MSTMLKLIFSFHYKVHCYCRFSVNAFMHPSLHKYLAIDSVGDMSDMIINKNKTQKKKSLFISTGILQSDLVYSATAEQACVRPESAHPKTMASCCSTVPQMFRQLEKFLELYSQDRHSILCRQDIQQNQHPQHSQPWLCI